jgi:hypothetical protein
MLCVSVHYYRASGQACDENPLGRLTNDFYYSATVVEGAVGDVVAIDVSLSLEQIHGPLVALGLVASFNPDQLEMLGVPVHSEFTDTHLWLPILIRLGNKVGPTSRSGLQGVYFGGNLTRDTGDALLAAGTVHLATYYFRVRGIPGQLARFAFVDDECYSEQFVAGVTRIGCWENQLDFETVGIEKEDFLYAHSTRHVDGVIHIVDGPPTHPDPPPLPPEARVYDEPVSAEGGNIVFELTGGLTSPGARDVPVELHITSNYEFTAYLAAGKFPSEHLELTRIEQHGRPGAQNRDNAAGEFWLLSAEGRRRIAAKGERVHVATLYFDVKEAASAVNELAVTLEPLRFGSIDNWVNVLGTAGGVEASTRVEPLVVTPARFLIRPAATVRGDVNLDAALDLSDAVALLGHLFQGTGDVACPGAADFNADGGVNVSDPIAILNHLFRGFGLPAGAAGEIPCDG